MAMLYVYLSSLLATHSAATSAALAFAAPTQVQQPLSAGDGLPDLCRLGNASFHLWDAPSTRCKACTGKGSGHLLQPDSNSSAPLKCDGKSVSLSVGPRARRHLGTGRERERELERFECMNRLRSDSAAATRPAGVVMESATGMAASFMTQPFVVEPTVVYNVSYEVRTTGLVATTAYLTGGVYAQFFDKRADFNESTDYNNEKVRRGSLVPVRVPLTSWILPASSC